MTLFLVLSDVNQPIINIKAVAAQTFFALRVLRSNGLSGNALWDVTQATLINKMLYASSLWWGFIDASDKQRLQSVLNKAVKLGFLPKTQAPCRNSANRLIRHFFPTSIITTIMFYITFCHLSRWLVMTWEDLLGIDLSSLKMQTTSLGKISFIDYQITIISILNDKSCYVTHSFITAAFFRCV